MRKVEKVLDVAKALKAICSTSEGHCWHCDERLPTAKEAIRTGWDVQRLEGERVASIILVCPDCLRRKAEFGQETFLRVASEGLRARFHKRSTLKMTPHPAAFRAITP